MQVAILCGGKGQRMSEITGDIPKPMALIGGKPILWHIMNIYYKYGFDEFILLLGYKGDKIKEYFLNEEWKDHDFVLDLKGKQKKIILSDNPPKWKIRFLDTGQDTMTGSRIKLAEKYITDRFMLTYGDGISDVNIPQLIDFHNKMGKLATLTGVASKSQFGIITEENGLAKSFNEKPDTSGDNMINGGFFVFEKEVFNYLDDSGSCILERSPLMKLSEEKQLAVYKHIGFWSAIDTYKDLVSMNEDWADIYKKIKD